MQVKRAKSCEVLPECGFFVREDSSMADWNDRFANGRAKVERGSYMRIAIARA